MINRLPTAREIDTTRSWECQYAVDYFHGKTIAQAQRLFRMDPSDRSSGPISALELMGPVGFCYYIHAAVAYVQSKAADEDWQIIDELGEMLVERVKSQPDQLRPIASNLVAFCDYVLNNLNRFGISENESPRFIYDWLVHQFRELVGIPQPPNSSVPPENLLHFAEATPH